MKKIRCNLVSSDWVKIAIAEDTEKPEDVIIEVKSSEYGCVRLNPDKIRKLRKQLKRALVEIEGGAVEGKKAQDEGDDWFSVGKLVKVAGNSNDHQFSIGEIVRIIEIDSDGDAKSEYLDGHDWWWVSKSDCEPA